MIKEAAMRYAMERSVISKMSQLEQQQRTPQKLPFFTNHATAAWTLEQVHQALTQVSYASFDYVPGKGKKDMTKKTKINIQNAHIINGVMFFFDEAAKLINKTCPAFCDVKTASDKDKTETISGPTLSKMWKTKIEYRIEQRKSWGKGPCAFHQTGDGDFPELEGSSDEKFAKSFICASIDDLLDVHLKNLAEQESRNRSAGSSSPDHPLSKVNDTALVVFQQHPNQHTFGKRMDPPACDGQVATSSLKRLGDQTGSANTKRGSGKAKDDSVEKTLQVASSVSKLSDKLLQALNPSEDDIVMKARATAGVYTEAMKGALVEGIKVWKEPAVAKSNPLLSMSCTDVIQKIKQIGTLYSTNSTFEAQFIACGINGATLSCMGDEDLRKFFELQCNFPTYQASILVASIKSWQLH
jgi:hypothetical protein